MRLSNLFDKFQDRNPVKFKGSIFLALVFFYFSFHLITGERGLLAYVKLKGEISDKRIELTQLSTEKNSLAHRVVGMRDSSLDLDLLEEVARKDLGYSHKDEIVYFWK